MGSETSLCRTSLAADAQKPTYAVDFKSDEKVAHAVIKECGDDLVARAKIVAVVVPTGGHANVAVVCENSSVQGFDKDGKWTSGYTAAVTLTPNASTQPFSDGTLRRSGSVIIETPGKKLVVPFALVLWADLGTLNDKGQAKVSGKVTWRDIEHPK